MINKAAKTMIIMLIFILAFGLTDSSADTQENRGQTMTLDVRQVDIKDILSVLAIQMGVNIILVDDQPVEVTIKVNNVTPKAALELITQKYGMSYLQHGDIIVVAETDKLEKDFFSQMIITRFDTRYVTTDIVKEMINELDFETVKSLTSENNPNVIWVQGTAQALKKVRELITAVDIEPQLAPQIEAEQMTRFVYKLKHIVANDAAERLEKFGFDGIRTISTDGDRFGKELMVVCPKSIETEVRSALGSLDMPREKVRAPLITQTGDNAHQKLNATRDLLSQLSGVPIANMTISRNLGDRNDPRYVLWVEETPDRIKLLEDLINKI